MSEKGRVTKERNNQNGCFIEWWLLLEKKGENWCESDKVVWWRVGRVRLDNWAETWQLPYSRSLRVGTSLGCWTNTPSGWTEGCGGVRRGCPSGKWAGLGGGTHCWARWAVWRILRRDRNGDYERRLPYPSVVMRLRHWMGSRKCP